MQSFGWKKNHSVKEWLLAEGYRFDFFQAIRLLEQIGKDSRDEPQNSSDARMRSAVPLGKGSNPVLESVRLRANIAFSFPPSAIHEVRQLSDVPFRAEVTTNFLGLAGALGPLPDSFAELLLDRLKHHDTGLRDFLDIFHHRLLSLIYRVRQRHRLWLERERPEDSKQASYIYTFSGLGLPELQSRMQVKDIALLAYAGLLWQRPRSAVGLEQIVSDHFGVAVTAQQNLGLWRSLERDNWTRLGKSGCNQILGLTAVVGQHYWDQQGRFDLTLGPLSLSQFLELLPGKSSHLAMAELVRFYTGDQFQFCFNLILRAKEVPPARLGTAQLGWTSWLKTREVSNEQVVKVRGEAMNGISRGAIATA